MQVVDETVSRAKFAREIGHLQGLGQMLAARGWWIMSATFPYVKVAFAATKAQPIVIPFAVKVDFTDYDAQPLALTFEAPFEDRQLLPGEMMTRLPRGVPSAPADPGAAETPAPQVAMLYQSYDDRPQEPGFLCLPGVRAYHAHPAHSGDPWELRRQAGEGKLYALLDAVWRYGPRQVTGLQINMNIGLQVAIVE